MTIQKSTWNRYIDVLAAIDRTAAKKFTAYLNTHDISSQAGRKAAIDYAAALADKYGESAAAMACEMYDAVAAASGTILPAAEPAATATYGEVAKTVNGMAKQNAGNDAMGSAIGRMVKRTGVDTTMKNALRDGAQWAWIPSGDSCAFCLTLASRGWQRASKKVLKNGHAEHIHSNCDCTYAVRFDSRSNVAGYDPDALYKQYQGAEGNTPQEKINSMRRELYAENGDKIRAQKREVYDRNRRIQFGSRSEVETDKGTIIARRIDKYGYNNIYVDENLTLTERQLRNVNGQVSEAKQLLGITEQCNVQVIVTDSNDRLAAYNPRTNILMISSQMTSDAEIRRLQEGYACPKDTRSTMVHELFHWKDADEYRKTGKKISASDFKSDYVQYRCEIGKAKLLEAGVDIDNIDEIAEISDYSVVKWFDNDYDEVYTEFRTKQLLEG